MNACLNHYFIGRDDQSVNEANMIKRIDQQFMVNKMMNELVAISQVKVYAYKKAQKLIVQLIPPP